MTKLYSIYLGSKCNLNCKYCHRESSSIETGISDKLIEVLKSAGPGLAIRFVGGEPSLYLSEMKKITEQFPWAEYHITTNGMNITPELIEFYKYYNFVVHVSFDGNTEMRGCVPDWEALKPIGKQVKCTITLFHGNTDLNRIESEILKVNEILRTNVFCMPHPMHDTNEVNTEFSLTKEDYESLETQIRERLSKYFCSSLYDITIEDPAYQELLTEYFKFFLDRYRRYFWYGDNYCCSEEHHRVDWNGNLYSCSYIRDTKLSDVSEHVGIMDKLMDKTVCKGCYVYDMCGGGCTKSNSRELECNYYKSLFLYFKVLANYYSSELDKPKWNALQRSHKEITTNRTLYSMIKQYHTMYPGYSYMGTIHDRFGFWNGPKICDLPKENHRDIHEVASERARQIGPCTVCWSGGVDSTYIVSQFVANKIPVLVVCDSYSIADGKEFYDWMIAKGIPVKRLDSIKDCYDMENLVHGYLADNMFAPFSETDKLDGSLEDLVKDLVNPEYYLRKLKAYGEYLGKPVNTYRDAIRLLNFGCFFDASVNDWNYFISPDHKMTSFFQTEEFSNICYTQFWDKTYADGKREFIQFISFVVGKDMTPYLRRNPTRMYPRLKMDIEVYNNKIYKLVEETVNDWKN